MSHKKATFWQVVNAMAGLRLLLFSSMASLILVLVSTPADAQYLVPNPLQNPICSKIDKQIQVSQGLLHSVDDLDVVDNS